MKTSRNVVLITGGNSGIGLALARKFMEAGNEVIVTGRSTEKLSSVKTQNPQIQIERADITNELDTRKLTETYRNVNILINNAGIHHDYDFKDPSLDLELIKAEIYTNLIGPMILTKCFLPILLAKENSAIINVSSYWGITPMPSAPGYCSSKAGMHFFTKALRSQLLKTNVKVFELLPPTTDTPMTKEVPPGSKMSTEALIATFWKGFKNDRFEIYPGLAKTFYIFNRLCPNRLETMVRNKLKQVRNE